MDIALVVIMVQIVVIVVAVMVVEATSLIFKTLLLCKEELHFLAADAYLSPSCFLFFLIGGE